jgi:single-stranded DNA-binding protein
MLDKFIQECAIANSRKGDLIAVFGRLREETWTTPGGEKRSKLVVVAQTTYPVARLERDDSDTPAAADRPAREPASQQPTAPSAADPDADGLPF